MDGATSNVRTRVSVEQEGTYICYSYQRGDSINHDPKLGLPLGEALVPGDAFDLLEHLLPFVGAIVIGAVIIGVAVGARRRRNGRN